jgi:hypothetical protein
VEVGCGVSVVWSLEGKLLGARLKRGAK